MVVQVVQVERVVLLLSEVLEVQDELEEQEVLVQVLEWLDSMRDF